MATEANPHYFATATKDDTDIDQITDSTDFPHTGLIKALSLGMRGNYVVKGSATDFDITQASSGNVLQVAEGKIFRDGAFLPVSADNFTASDFQATANTHHLLVADNATPPVLKIRKHGSSTQNAIPPYDDGDTIIAIITYTSNGFNDMVVQYLTTSKVANNVSIGYGTSAYTEAMSISASAGDTTIENKVSDKDIIFKVNDGGASSESMRIDGDINQVKIKSLGIGTAAELTITESSDDITIKNTVADKDIIFNINDSDGGGDTEIMRLDGSTKNVGIGTSQPKGDLHVTTTGGNITLGTNEVSNVSGLLIESTANHTGSDSGPMIVFYRNGSNAAAAGGSMMANVLFVGEDSANNATIYGQWKTWVIESANGNESYAMAIQGLVNGTNRGFIHCLGAIDDGSNPTDFGGELGAEVVINQNSANIDFRVESENNISMLFVDAANDAVSVGTTTPDTNAALTVEGAISLDEISAPTNTADRGQLYTNADNHLHFINGAGTDVKVTEEVFIVALSDETTDLTTGTAKASFNMPFAMTLTGVKANCTTAPVGSTIIVDINEAGSTILSTKLSIDASETTSTSAASAAVISDTALANDALITFDIDQVGSSTAGKGLKVTLYGYRA